MSEQNWQPWRYLPELAAAQIPRYTSYPPANRFSSDISPRDVAEAIERLPPGSPLSLYLHIPFCHQLCWYCGCHTSVPTKANPLDPYVEALMHEIDLVGRLSGRRRVTHVHFGGGSPNILSPEQIDALFGRLRDQFELAPDAELCAELDPRSFSPATAAAFAGNGLTRASIGVQVLDSKVQALINRIQPIELVDDVLMRLRDAAVGSINMDVMYGLPGQTSDHVRETVDYAIEREADRVAVFGYAHVPWFKKHQGAIKSATLPAGEIRFRQAEVAARCLVQAGYVPVGFDHYALPHDPLARAAERGDLRRNFQGYTADNADNLLGFGVSAISSVGRLHFQNAPDTARYKQRILDNRPAVVRGARVNDDELAIGNAITTLLCQFEAEMPQQTSSFVLARLNELEGLGIVSLKATRLRVTEAGRPYVRHVAAAIDPAYHHLSGQHSLAI